MAHGFASILIGVSAAIGQTPPSEKPVDPGADPALKDSSLTDVIEGQQGRPPGKPIKPTRDEPKPLVIPAATVPAKSLGAIPGLPSELSGLPARRFYPEGTFLSRRHGKLIKASTGDTVFVASRDVKGRGEAPMVLLPCQTLARLEVSPDAFGSASVAVVSGQIYVYFDRQYLLPTAYSIERTGGVPVAPASPGAPSPAGPATSVPAKPAADAASKGEPPASKSADPSVDDLLRELETKRGSVKAIEAPRPVDGGGKIEEKPTGAGQSDQRGVMPESSTLFNRRATLIRLPGGQLAAAFDNDPDSPGALPMVFLRCRAVQKLEELVQARGDELQLQVSGRVMVYAGLNYLMPTLVQVVPRGDVKTLQ